MIGTCVLSEGKLVREVKIHVTVHKLHQNVCQSARISKLWEVYGRLFGYTDGRHRTVVRGSGRIVTGSGLWDIGDSLQIWRTADGRGPPAWGLGEGLTPNRKETGIVMICYTGPRTWTDSLEQRRKCIWSRAGSSDRFL